MFPTEGQSDELLYCGKRIQVKHFKRIFEHMGHLQVPITQTAIRDFEERAACA
jgi:hypothetical protein